MIGTFVRQAWRLGENLATERIYIRINATRAASATWGDTQFAQGLARALNRLPGCDCRLLYRGERPELSGPPCALVQIVGPHLEEPVPGLPNLLWMISPPNVAPMSMLARYQGVFIAADHLTRRLQRRGLDADYLPQATETGHFHPSRRPENAPDIPVVFVGGYASRVGRRIVLDAVESGFEPWIWGPGWRGIVPDRLWRGERLAYHELAEIYARATVVLNSHMTGMAKLGFMSNRSYDALASGAMVVSDRVAGFSDPAMPEILQVAGADHLRVTLRKLVDVPAPDQAARLALHDRVARHHGFEARATVILAKVRELLARGAVAQPAFLPGRTDAVPLVGDLHAGRSEITESMLFAALEITRIARHLEQSDLPPPPAPDVGDGMIHALSADLSEIREIARQGSAATRGDRLDVLAGRALRLIEAFKDKTVALRLRSRPAEYDLLLNRILSNEPLWAHEPEGFARDGGKVAVPLRPRKQAPALARPVGVFVHLYYDELTPIFVQRLAHVAVPHHLYVSTDTDQKAALIRSHLPDADVRVFANRGRDIWPKLYGFADAHAQHDVVLHLHGKRSAHSDRLDEWLSHVLDCLVGSEGEVNRVLSFFDSIPRLGMVVPVTFRGVLGSAHWGANRDIARELARRMALTDPLPDNDALRFPVGSMFWARSAAIRPLLDLDLPQTAFPPEAGQVDGTLAHAIERMLGVSCRATGHHILPVMAARAKLYRKHQFPFSTNRDLREALASGVFDG